MHPLARQLLVGEIRDGGRLVADVRGGTIVFSKAKVTLAG